MIGTDKERERIANIIAARNKYIMLRTRKERIDFIMKETRMLRYVIVLLGKRKKECKGRCCSFENSRANALENTVAIYNTLDGPVKGGRAAGGKSVWTARVRCSEDELAGWCR